VVDNSSFLTGALSGSATVDLVCILEGRMMIPEELATTLTQVYRLTSFPFAIQGHIEAGYSGRPFGVP
jgi:hypothetical protein